jgi:hypothetical protein
MIVGKNNGIVSEGLATSDGRRRESLDKIALMVVLERNNMSGKEFERTNVLSDSQKEM